MFICPECRSVYTQTEAVCERDQSALIPVQANQDPRTYPLLNTELDGRYHLIGGLGQGGVGTVYLANHIHLDQLSAVKFLDVDMLGEVDEEQREESLQDFVKEAKLAMMLRHDYVVRVMDYGVHERCPFLVMEYVPGPSLLRRMNAGEKFTTEQCINVITRLAEALSAFHDRKLVHRDLKPANVILDPRDNGHITLVDLGLVKDLSNEARSSTHPLALRGTPGYLAPEQVPSWVLSSAGADVTGEKQPVDARVDIYALGILAFELLSEQTPYPKGMSPTKVIVHMCTKPTPDLAEICPEIQLSHPGLVSLVKDMMAKKPQERPLDARGVLKRLRELNTLHTSNAIKTEVNISDEIERATQALISHVKPVPLAPMQNVAQRAQERGNKRRQEPSLTSRPPLSQLGSLIPPPASLMRPSQEVSLESHRHNDSTMHMEETFDGTIDEVLDSDRDVSMDLADDDLLHAKTQIAERPLEYLSHSQTKAESKHFYPLVGDEEERGDKALFWIGVVLVSIIIGGASVLFNDVDQGKQSPTRLVLGNRYQASQKKRSSDRVLSKRQINYDKRPAKVRPKSNKANAISYQSPTLRIPSRDPVEENKRKTTSISDQKSGVVEVELKPSAPIDHDQADRRSKRVRSSRSSRSLQRSRRKKSKKSTDDRPQLKRTSKPLSSRQYKLLKLQVETLLRNQRVIEARRKLSSVRSKLKPSDQFYMEINMLLDSISN